MIYPIIVSFSLALLLRPAYSRAQPAKSGNSRFASVGAEDDVVKRLCITHDLDILVCLVFVACLRHAAVTGVAATPHCATLSLSAGLLGLRAFSTQKSCPSFFNKFKLIIC